ncbi:MAG: gfo/Idh/MocA family oxidoreductase, partial [Rhodospirillales bacterium]|nr:gfo/Idh/MocA family oxidoreductase [Rhodospirillales bacterium]
AMLHSSATQWRHRFNLDITLERGSVSLSGILSGSKSYGAETLIVAEAAEDDRGDPREDITRYNNDPSWSDEVAEFADAIRSGQAIENGTSVDALKTMQLVYRIYCADARWKAKWGLNGGEGAY